MYMYMYIYIYMAGASCRMLQVALEPREGVVFVLFEHGGATQSHDLALRNCR